MSWGTPWAQRQGPPKIDLLPRQLTEQRLVRRQRGGIGVAFLLLLTVLGLWFVMEQRQLGEAERELDQERAVAADLRSRRAGLQPLADLEAQIAAAEQLRAQVYARELRFSTVMRDISAIVPDDVWLTTMSATFKDDAAAAAAANTAAGSTGATGAAEALTPGAPGAGSPVATITFGGSGLGHIDVGGFLRALARGPKKGGQQVYLNPYFTTSQKGDDAGEETVTFTATVDLSSAAFSGRYQAQPAGTVTP
jgi:Tfp pilus assembly protein PilN